MLSFSLVAVALAGLIYHRPTGEISLFFGLIFVSLNHEPRHKSALDLRQPAKQKLPVVNRKRIRQSGEWLEDFYGNIIGVPDWYTTYGKAAIATTGEFERMLANTEVHKIVRISKTNQDNRNL